MSTSSSSTTHRTLTLEQVAALGDEIAALVQSGVPLERGLTELSTELSGGIGALTARLAKRLDSGQSLDDALEDEETQLPATTVAIIRAGLRSGQLAPALQSYATLARRISSLRNTAGLSLLYPVFVVLITWVLFWLYVVVLMPRMASFEEVRGTWQLAMQRLENTAMIWGPGGPLLLIVGLGIWWYVSRRSGGTDPRLSRFRLGWIPAAKRIALLNQQATFAETLATLIENQVPLSEALCLAGNTTGSAALADCSQQLSTAIESGETPAKAVANVHGFPPLVVWLLQSAPTMESLVKGLRHASETYLERGEDLSRWLTITLPVLLTLLLGGTAVLCYSLAVLLPWFQTMQRIVES